MFLLLTRYHYWSDNIIYNHMEYVWNIDGICLEYWWNMSGIIDGICLEYCWNISGILLEYFWNIAGILMIFCDELMKFIYETPIWWSLSKYIRTIINHLSSPIQGKPSRLYNPQPINVGCPSPTLPAADDGIGGQFLHRMDLTRPQRGQWMPVGRCGQWAVAQADPKGSDLINLMIRLRPNDADKIWSVFFKNEARWNQLVFGYQDPSQVKNV